MSDDDEEEAPPVPALEPTMPTLRERLIAAGTLTPREDVATAPERVWPRERGHRGGVKHRRAYQ